MDLGYALNSFVSAYKPPLGSFAELVFEVSSFRVLTYDDWHRESKARYARHELINQTTVLEYLGPDTEKISLTIKFSARLNVNPPEEAQKVRQMCLDGVADYLIIGNRVIGGDLWVITAVGEKATSWDNGGNILFSELDVTFESYVPAVNEQ